MTRLPLLFGTLALVAALPALAETGVRFSGLKTDATAPVQVQADQLTIDQTDGAATFQGNVVVVQSDLELKAASVVVIYESDGKGIAELRATGGVTVKAGNNAASADTAVYTVAPGQLVLEGNVLLAEGQATLSGQKLTVNLKTGLGTMEGRVTTTFAPGGN